MGGKRGVRPRLGQNFKDLITLVYICVTGGVDLWHHSDSGPFLLAVSQNCFRTF